MSIEMTPAEFAAWEALQPLRFDLVDGVSMLRLEASQVDSRLARVRKIVSGALGDGLRVDAWMTKPTGDFGGLSPEDVAAESEDGAQMVLRLLVTSARRVRADHG